MPAISLFRQPSARVAAAGWLVGLLALSGCHVHVDRPCCKFNWRVSVCGLTSNCHECRKSCCDQPTLAPAQTPEQASGAPYSLGIQQVDPAAERAQTVTPTVRLPAFPTQQTATQPTESNAATNIAAQIPAGQHAKNADGDLQTLEMNFDPNGAAAPNPAPAQLLVPRQEPVAKVHLPSKPSQPVRARARDASASNTILVAVSPPAESALPTLAKPEQFASENGSSFADQSTASSATRGPGVLRLTAIPKLSPNSFPPLITMQPAPLDPAGGQPVPYQIVIAPLSKEPNRRPLEPVLEAQRLGRVLEDGNTLRR